MVGRQQLARLARGAFGVLLAYAFLLQVIVGGLATERMTFAAMDGASPSLCASIQNNSHAKPGHSGPGQTDADHYACCPLCAFSLLSPLLPMSVAAGQPVAAPLPAARSGMESPPAPGLERYEPRTSQGPPLNA